MPVPVSLLVSSTLNNVKVNNTNLKKGTASLVFSKPTNMLLFQDRPGNEAFSVDWDDLTSRKSWRSLFGKKANFHTFFGEDGDLLDIEFSKPSETSEGTYTTNIKFANTNILSNANNIDQIQLFANLADKESGQVDFASAETGNSVPSGSDFMAKTEDLKVTFKPKTGRIKIKGDDSLSISYFSPVVAGSSKQGSLSFENFSAKENWKQFFENDNPNSVLAWSDGDKDFQLAFKQSRPKFRKDGSWFIKGVPMIESKNEKKEYISEIGSGKTISIDNSTLMVDSTGDVITGSVNWKDLLSAAQALNAAALTNPQTWCMDAGAAGAVASFAEGFAADVIDGTAVPVFGAITGAGGGALAGLAIGSMIAAPADLTGLPEISGLIGGAFAGFGAGGLAGLTADTVGIPAFDAAITTIDTALGVSTCEFLECTGKGGTEECFTNYLKEVESLFTFADSVASDTDKLIDGLANTATSVTKDAVSAFSDIKSLF